MALWRVLRGMGRIRPRRVLRAAVLFVLLLLTVYLLLESNFTHVVLDTAHARANAIAVDIMNEAVRETLKSDTGAAYETLVTVLTDEAGRVTMLQANTARMNELAVRIALTSQDMLSLRDKTRISVPLGAALGVPFLSSIGPKIEVSLSPVGAVRASFVTEFESAGINQTRHKIWLLMHASVRLVLPTGAKAVDINTEILIAESIIVGDVPDSYIEVPDVDDSLNFAI